MGLQNLLGDLALDATLAELLTALQGATGTRDEPAGVAQKGIPALAMRGDSDTIGTADGDLSLVRVDEEGRVKVATKPASITAIVGTANTVAATVVADVRRASNVVFHVKNVGSITLAAGTFVFEGSIDSTNGTDGTWFTIQAVRSNANTVETQIALSGIAAGAGYAASWEASVNGYSWMRLRCSVAVTASASAQWTIQRGSYATEPIPAAQVSATQPVSGTVTITNPNGSTYNVETTAAALAAAVKASAGSLFEITIANVTGTAAFVKLYNKTTAPVPASDTPVLTIHCPANSTTAVQFGQVGKRFATGIAIGATGASGKADTSAVTAGIQINATYV